MFKKEKGITLVALIITIIVLIILAGVTISLVVDDNGIIQKSKNAKTNMLNAQNLENEQLHNAENVINGLQ